MKPKVKVFFELDELLAELEKASLWAEKNNSEWFKYPYPLGQQTWNEAFLRTKNRDKYSTEKFHEYLKYKWTLTIR